MNTAKSLNVTRFIASLAERCCTEHIFLTVMPRPHATTAGATNEDNMTSPAYSGSLFLAFMAQVVRLPSVERPTKKVPRRGFLTVTPGQRCWSPPPLNPSVGERHRNRTELCPYGISTVYIQRVDCYA